MMTVAARFKIKPRFIRLGGIIIVLLGLIRPDYAAAQTPELPFLYYLTSTLDDNRATYHLALAPNVDWPLSDVTVRVALPPGTTFVDTQTQPPAEAGFDGEYINFYLPTLGYWVEGLSFTVDFSGTASPILNTHSLVLWQGSYPGRVRLETDPLDTRLTPLNWQAPGDSRLQVGARAVVKPDTITYEIYPKSIETRYRMWDVRLNLQLPPGTEVTAFTAPPPFQAGLDGSVVHFSTLELPRLADVGPLTVTLPRPAGATLNAQLWASWKNGSKAIPLPDETDFIYPDSGVEDPLPPPEETIMLDVSLDPVRPEQHIVFDPAGDAAFGSYDLTRLTISETGPAATIGFTAAGRAEPDSPAQFTLYFDSDCNRSTGEPRLYHGPEHRLDYAGDTGLAFWVSWDEARQDWRWDDSRDLTAVADGDTVTVSVPNFLFEASPHFCWTALARVRPGIYHPEPPGDRLTNAEFRSITQYSLANTIVPETEAPLPDDAAASVVAPGTLAVPMQNWQGFFDVILFSMPDLEEIALIPGARQPNFRPDGEALLINRQHTLPPAPAPPVSGNGSAYTYVFKDIGAGENIYEYNLADGTETRASSNPDDSHPFYGPGSDQFVYGNAAAFPAADGTPLARLVIPCGLRPPQPEDEPCHPANRLLASLGQEQGVWGRYPLWTADNSIVFQGCAAQNSTTICGLYALEAQSLSNGVNLTTPTLLSRHPGDIPADTKSDWLAFTSRRDGDWEAYLMKLDGSGLINLSNNPAANDGLPAIAPDGSQVAFVSDRDGRWAIWMTPISGGPAKKLFNLYGAQPLGAGDAWLTERLSWGK